MTTPDMWFFLGGLIGAAARVLRASDQDKFSMKSAVDIVIGGLIGLVYPTLASQPIPLSGTVVQQAGLIAIASFTSTSLLQGFIIDKSAALSKLLPNKSLRAARKAAKLAVSPPTGGKS